MTLNDIKRDMNFMNEAINQTYLAIRKFYEKSQEFSDLKEKDKLRKNMKNFSKKFRNSNLNPLFDKNEKFSENFSKNSQKSGIKKNTCIKKYTLKYFLQPK